MKDNELKFAIIITDIAFFIGTFSNTTCIIMYSRKIFHQISASFYFKAISLNNLIILSLKVCFWNFEIQYISDKWCKFVMYMIYTIIPVSSWIMVYVLLDRFISIKFYKKFQFRHLCKFKYFILILIYLTTFCVYMPVATGYKIFKINYFNSTEKTNCKSNGHSELISMIDLIYLTLLPFICMIFFTILLVFTIFQSRKRLINKIQSIDKSIQKKDIRFAFTSIFLILIFLATNLPLNMLAVFSTESSEFLTFIFNLIADTNIVFNIFIHFLTNKLFRNEMFKIISEIKKLRKKISPMMAK